MTVTLMHRVRYANGREVVVPGATSPEHAVELARADLAVCGIDGSGVQPIAPSAALLDLLTR